ncbi:unnamed protein product [Trichobilharzia regenti]|nr:unnamed protein product [Trichobilharzia regenti]
MTVYHNNPALRSQPQYADVFVELQGQMQQIETQLHAKRAQLNLARTQEPGAQSVVRPPLLPPNGADVADNSFPAIGTWMSPSPNCAENFDKTLTDGPGCAAALRVRSSRSPQDYLRPMASSRE